MPVYTVPAQDGVHEQASRQKGELYHDVAISAEGGAPVGSLILKARKPGGDIFEDIPDGDFDLSDLNSIQFVGSVAEYQFTISGLSGVTSLSVTDTTGRVGS